jgi:arylsulfatase
MKFKNIIALLTFVLGAIFALPAGAQEKKPNIVVIWGDDIGMWNVGIYTHGMMGRTPNIEKAR